MVYLHPWEIDPDQPRVAACLALPISSLSEFANNRRQIYAPPGRFFVGVRCRKSCRVPGAQANRQRGEAMAFKILSVVGARPNFMKVAAVCEAIKEYNATRQKSTASTTYWCTPASITTPTCRTCFLTTWSFPSQICFWESAQVLTRRRPRKSWKASRRFFRRKSRMIVIVVGDVNSTVACALVTKKTYCAGRRQDRDFIPRLAHVEAGLRSFDRTMPEEVNRIVTDAFSDYLFTTEESANENLKHEGSLVQ